MRRVSFVLVSLAVVVAGAGGAHAKRCPNLMFVVDRSGSMLEDPLKMGKKPSKWDLVVASISAAVNRFGDRIPFGLVTFASAGGGLACEQGAVLEVECQIGNGPRINQRLNAIQPSGNTNTSDGIRRAIDDGKLDDPLRGNYIILITDGDPNCSVGEPNDTYNEITRGVAQNRSIHTYVVGFEGSGGVNPAILNQMAINGKEPIAGCQQNKVPCYYSASSPQQFLLVLDSIMGGLLQGCDDTCFSNGCPNGQICTIDSQCAPPSCQPDPCQGTTCAAGMYCNIDGHCERPCPHCNADEFCRHETCFPLVGCALSKNCGPGQVCNPRTGSCIRALCVGAPFCPPPTTCDLVTGCCADDPCRLVNCPPYATCFDGYCMEDPPRPPARDLAIPDDLTALPTVDQAESVPGLHQDGCGCNVSGRGRRPALPWLLLAGLCLVTSSFFRRSTPRCHR